MTFGPNWPSGFRDVVWTWWQTTTTSDDDDDGPLPILYAPPPPPLEPSVLVNKKYFNQIFMIVIKSSFIYQMCVLLVSLVNAIWKYAMFILFILFHFIYSYLIFHLLSMITVCRKTHLLFLYNSLYYWKLWQRSLLTGSSKTPIMKWFQKIIDTHSFV